MNNYKLTLQYDGTNYAGWQVQKNAPSVQQKIIDAIELILKVKVNLIGSGRTDTGVHAWGQVANFRIESELDLYRFHYSLNSILPKDISIKKIEKTDDAFHARFDAKSRSYIYLISESKSPFFDRYCYYLPSVKEIDFEKLNELGLALIGKHDFTSYSRKNIELEDKTCTISNIWCRKGKNLSTFHITADRFLHGMVRTILGTILFAEKNKLDQKYLLEVIDKMDREHAAESVPAKGLFLFKVRY